MGRMICKRGGIKPDGKTPCDAFDKKKWVCTFSGSCELQEEQIDEEAIRSLEEVNVPGEIQGILERLKRRPDLFEILGTDIYAPIKEALKIVDKTCPLGKVKSDGGEGTNSINDIFRYWENPEAMQFDMGKLSALSVHIDTLASKMESDKERSERALSSAKAEKFLAIRTSFEAGIRVTDRITDGTINNMVKVDPQIKDLTEVMLKTSEAAQVFRNFYRAVDAHIQVMKKRVDSAREEKRNVRTAPG